MTRVAAIAGVGDRLVPLIMACPADISDRCRYMLLLRPARVVRHWPGRRCFSYSQKARQGPFNVLFCGSDEFSIGSLEAVLQARGAWAVGRETDCRCMEEHTRSDARYTTGRAGRAKVEEAARRVQM